MRISTLAALPEVIEQLRGAAGSVAYLVNEGNHGRHLRRILPAGPTAAQFHYLAKKKGSLALEVSTSRSSLLSQVVFMFTRMS